MGFLWRGGLPPFQCAALAKSCKHARFWGCFATQRGQAPSPQRLHPKGRRWFMRSRSGPPDGHSRYAHDVDGTASGCCGARR
ncbi:hypothetical protein C1Y11_01680 [Pseudomonas sp. FW305-20]|nr:hypothetical protein C1Y11_01680 [Pseudomonas sp. FW305-20]PMX68525.1 hypothetical protein C1X12_10695 [Pseudomonas sp. FW305-60]